MKQGQRESKKTPSQDEENKRSQNKARWMLAACINWKIFPFFSIYQFLCLWFFLFLFCVFIQKHRFDIKILLFIFAMIGRSICIVLMLSEKIADDQQTSIQMYAAWPCVSRRKGWLLLFSRMAKSRKKDEWKSWLDLTED